MGGHGLARSASNRFPLLLGVGCIAASALLFLTGTAPAIREQGHLETIEKGRLELLQQLKTQTEDLGLRFGALRGDPQAILVEMDRLGMIPEELDDVPHDPPPPR